MSGRARVFRGEDRRVSSSYSQLAIIICLTRQMWPDTGHVHEGRVSAVEVLSELPRGVKNELASIVVDPRVTRETMLVTCVRLPGPRGSKGCVARCVLAHAGSHNPLDTASSREQT